MKLPGMRQRSEVALRTLPSPGKGCHPAILGVANLGAMAGVDAVTIERDIRQAIPAGGREIPDREIRDAVIKARAECSVRARIPLRRQKISLKGRCKRLNGQVFRRRLIDQGDGADETDLWEISPIRIDWEPGSKDALCVLETLWKPDEQLFIGEAYDTEVKAVEDIRETINSGMSAPPHIILNPVDGKLHQKKDGGMSYRCDEAIADHRYALVEFDDMLKAEQLAYWYSIISNELLPVAALIDSGGKSIHAWLRVSLPDVEAWNRIVRRGMYDKTEGRMRLQGADGQCQNPSRLSRLPGHYRKGKGAWQRLLYLNPDAGI